MNPTFFNRLVISGFVVTTFAVIYLFIQNRRINSRLNIELAAFNNNFKEISNVLSNTIPNTEHNLTPFVTEEFRNNIQMQQNEIEESENYDQLSVELKKELENLEIRESSNDEETTYHNDEHVEAPEYNEVINNTTEEITEPSSSNMIIMEEGLIEEEQDDGELNEFNETIIQENNEMNDYANLESDNYHTDSLVDDIISNVKENSNQINSETTDYYGKPIEFFNKFNLSELQDIARKDKIKVNAIGFASLDNSYLYLNAKNKKRIVISDFDEADYIIDNKMKRLREKYKVNNDNLKLVHKIVVNDKIISAIYEKKINR